MFFSRKQISFEKQVMENRVLSTVHYINLVHRTDRRKAVETQLAKYGVENVVRFDAISDVKGQIGCAKSHAAVLRMFLERSADPYLVVFEDDAEWRRDCKGLDSLLRDFFATGVSWNVIMLGASRYALRHEPGPIEGVRRCRCAQTSTAYVVHRDYVSRLLENFEASVALLEQGTDVKKAALDLHWKQLQNNDNWFITIPGFVKQRWNYSDIQKHNRGESFV